ncbi:hypothetical protein HanPSC8_Chr03g0131921 [Helianthus annuus]|nr:putative protein BRANCHLESS TRICHOME [Helianthus annuus]KAJ0945780.1 hypothetical protein HanPSC8_Chr03g0131921 [Helianthus annuus]
MEVRRSSEMPCKIRKRRLTTSTRSRFVMGKADLMQRNEKCVDKLDPSDCEEEEEEDTGMLALKKSGSDQVVEKSIMNVVDRSRNKSRVCVPEVINPHYRQSSSFMEKDNSFVGMPLTYVAKPFEGKSQPCGEIQSVTKADGQSTLKPTHGLDEIKHSLTVSRELLKLLTHVWTADTNHDHRHPTSISLASTLNHELNKARYHVNKLIQQQRANPTSAQESKDQDKIRFAVKTISRELETERKLRRQSERMNKKLGRELANTKAVLAKAVKKAESEKQATEVLEQLCEKMAQSIEEDRVELEELKKESERVRKEMEEEREMLRVADMLREERVHMKLIDAKYEYENKHEQLNILVRDLEELLEADNGIDHITPRVLSWYQSHNYKDGNKNGRTTWDEATRTLWHESEKGKVVNDENALGEETRGLSWFENKGEVVNDQMINTQNEVEVLMGRNSDCIEWEFGLDMKHETEEKISPGLASMKEYEDEMERYKMIKDLRDRIVSGGSDLSRDTIEFGSYM